MKQRTARRWRARDRESEDSMGVFVWSLDNNYSNDRYTNYNLVSFRFDFVSYCQLLLSSNACGRMLVNS